MQKFAQKRHNTNMDEVHRDLAFLLRNEGVGYDTPVRHAALLRKILEAPCLPTVLGDPSYLRMAIEGNVPTTITLQLLAVLPSQAEGLLIVAITNFAPERVAIELLRAWPAAAEEMHSGRHVLVFAIERRMFGLAAALLKAHPAAASNGENRDSTAFLTAIRLVDAIVVVDASRDPRFVRLLMQLLDVWPGAAGVCDSNGVEPLLYALRISGNGNGRVALVLRLIAISPASVRSLCSVGGGSKRSMLMRACESVSPWPQVVIDALIGAYPAAVALPCGVSGNTPLHATIHSAVTRLRGRTSKLAVVKAMIAAWPAVLCVRNVDGYPPLHYALKYGWRSDEKKHILAMNPDVANMDVVGDAFFYRSALFYVLSRSAREVDSEDNSVICAVFAASRSSFSVGRKLYSARYLLCRLLRRSFVSCEEEGMCAVAKHLISATVKGGLSLTSVALTALRPTQSYDAVLPPLPLEVAVALLKGSGKSIAHERNIDGSNALQYVVEFASKGGDVENTTNVLCQLLLRLGVVPGHVNCVGKTALQAASASIGTSQKKRRAYNHFKWTLSEHSRFMEGPRNHPVVSYKFSPMHGQHWSTIMHVHCAPSAKLVALTVLLVGETYKRNRLPRLPMDCWYRILYNIRRYELRIGACSDADEEEAQAEYTTILKAAKASVPASNGE